jgi:hypothetical protein
MAKLLPDQVWGEWEWDEAAGKPLAMYPAKVLGSWPGGVCFLTDKASAEVIVTKQAKVFAEFPDSDELKWDGDAIIRIWHGDDEPEEAERIEPDANGLYDCSFGWCWSNAKDLEEVA